MNSNKGKGKKANLILKTWERCISIGRNQKPKSPRGCFTVYVGPERERFVMKAEHANHPLFKILLEEAESEFGYSCDGPLVLPCDVALFKKVLLAMDDQGGGGGGGGGDDDEMVMIRRLGCCGGFSPYRLLSVPSIVAINQFRSCSVC